MHIHSHQRLSRVEQGDIQAHHQLAQLSSNPGTHLTAHTGVRPPHPIPASLPNVLNNARVHKHERRPQIHPNHQSCSSAGVPQRIHVSHVWDNAARAKPGRRELTCIQEELLVMLMKMALLG